VYDASDQWERFAQQDPYYGVLAHDRFHRENLDDAARASFFALGREHLDRVLAEARLLDPGFAPATALDYGCGVGRVLVPLARRVEHVVGVDVAPRMLDEARRNVDQQGLTNVELLHAGALHRAPPVDFVHSTIVLQHVPVRRGEEIFGRLAALLRPGGIAHVQVPVHVSHWQATAFVMAMRSLPLAHKLLNVARGRPWDYPHMEMNVYNLNRLAVRLMRLGLSDLRVRLEPGAPGRWRWDSAHLLFQRPR